MPPGPKPNAPNSAAAEATFRNQTTIQSTAATATTEVKQEIKQEIKQEPESEQQQQQQQQQQHQEQQRRPPVLMASREEMEARLARARAERDQAERMLARVQQYRREQQQIKEQQQRQQQQQQMAFRATGVSRSSTDLFQATQDRLSAQKDAPTIVAATAAASPRRTATPDTGYDSHGTTASTSSSSSTVSSGASGQRVLVVKEVTTYRIGIPSGVAGSAVNKEELLAAARKAQSGGNRTRSPSPSVAGPSTVTVVLNRPQRSRRRSSVGSNSPTTKSGDCDSSDAETIYSEQGYETVAICSVVEAEDDDDEDIPGLDRSGRRDRRASSQSDSSSSSSDDDDDDDGQGEGRVANNSGTTAAAAAEEVYTEYEVDSDADRAAEARREGAEGGGNSSAEDSDVQVDTI